MRLSIKFGILNPLQQALGLRLVFGPVTLARVAKMNYIDYYKGLDYNRVLGGLL